MRNLFATALLTLCSLLCSVQAANHYTVVVELTGNPSDGNTLVVQGTTKTFKTTVTSPSTQIEIGASAAATAANIVAHFDEYQLTNISPIGDPVTTTIVYLVANQVDLVMTASMTGSWGTADVEITSLVSSPLVLPLALEPANQERTNAANYMILGMRDYATTNFPATTPALVYFVSTTEAQTITGAKTFQNSGNLYDGGRMTNLSGAQIAAAWLGSVNISGDIGITNTNPKFLIYDSDSGANEKYSVISTGSGEFQINLYNDALSAFNTAFQIRRTGYAVDDIYFGAPLDVAGGATFNGTVTAPIISSTNITGILTDAYVFAKEITSSNFWLRTGSGNHFAITNASPAFRWYESDADADNRLWDWVVESGVMKLRVLSDDGAFDNTIFQVTRDDYNGGNMNIYANVELLTLSAIGATINGPLAAQDAIFTFATLPYMKLTNATSLGVDPTLGVYQWATSGDWFYRMVGSGTDHRGHNAASQSVGAGTDYPFTTSYAQVTFGSGGNTLTLPTAGTYLVTADVAIEAGATANAVFAAKLHNASTAADIVNSERQISNIPASKRGQVQLQNIVTVSGSAILHLYGRNLTDATGSIDSVETKLSYVRLF
jgi:hypothetical protein